MFQLKLRIGIRIGEIMEMRKCGPGLVSKVKRLRNELQEVYNKLGALNKALEEAEKL